MARRKQQQKHTFRGSKSIEQCILRRKNTVALVPEDSSSQRKWQTFPSISQAKRFCLEQMRKGSQIREVR